MRAIAYFLLGAAIGATVALLFAPKSGAELRADLQLTADKDKAKLQAEWKAAMAKADYKLSQVEAELKQALDEASSEEEQPPSEEGSEVPA